MIVIPFTALKATFGRCERHVGMLTNRSLHGRVPSFVTAKPSTRTLNPLQSVSAANNNDIEAVPPALLPPIATPDDLKKEAAWVGDFICSWLDDEWTPLDVHKTLGIEVSRIYCALRSPSNSIEEIEVGDVVLGIGRGLLAFDFGETFVGPFDVANKVAEVLMILAGCDVCCTSESDREAVFRSLEGP